MDGRVSGLWKDLLRRTLIARGELVTDDAEIAAILAAAWPGAPRPCAAAARCPTAAQDEPTRRRCTPHLEKALAGWNKFVAERRATGTCVNCREPSVAGELRCAKHKEINRAKCLLWSRVHPDAKKRSTNK